MKQRPEGWKEPMNQALARPDLLLGCPRFTQCHWAIWMAWTMASGDIFKHLMPGVCLQALLIWLTQLDAEWPDVLSNFVSDSGSIDP